jgi:hypothetical protein
MILLWGEEGKMNTYIFSGKVMPERANVNISALLVKMQAKEAGVSGEATVSVEASQISVVLNTKDMNPDLPTLKNYVEYLIRTIIDAYGYLSGRGYDVEVTSVVDPEGKQGVFGVGIRELEKAEKERPLSFQELLQVMKSPYLCRALGDLRESIRSPMDSGFFCYRAAECVRQSFREEEDGDDSKPSWERLRNALRIDKSWIEKLKKFADPQRHGATPYMSGEERVSAMQHAWKVVDRFCVYAHQGFKPLSEKDFNMLQEP